MIKEQTENKQKESINLQDLLIDEQAHVLSDYLSLSIENMGEDTKVTFTTIEDNPIKYSTTLSGVSFSGL
ncbi:MAG: type I secretion C-terminal target domain-containing protein [Methylococcales bacterium]|nr:type I secretion C-terminal target domain-containing protein [Methylococcales bacterium]